VDTSYISVTRAGAHLPALMPFPSQNRKLASYVWFTKANSTAHRAHGAHRAHTPCIANMLHICPHTLNVLTPCIANTLHIF
jgi:hypothetical protein